MIKFVKNIKIESVLKISYFFLMVKNHIKLIDDNLNYLGG